MYVDIFSTGVVGVHMPKDKIVLSKPIYIGQAVPYVTVSYSNSKLEMYNLYYNILRKCTVISQPDFVGVASSVLINFS